MRTEEERYYLPVPLHAGSIVVLGEREFHHLAHVCRNQEGDEVTLINGLGDTARGTIQELQKHSALILIEHVEHHPPPRAQIVLAQAIPQPSKLDWILEKGTELGVTEFLLFPGSKGKREHLSASQQTRAHAILVAAIKQCGRTTLPIISYFSALPLERIQGTTAYFGDLRTNAPPLHSRLNNDSTVLFFNGSESGWSAQEVQQLETHGALGISLHSNTLRTETAAITAVSLISHLLSARLDNK